MKSWKEFGAGIVVGLIIASIVQLIVSVLQ